MSKLNKISISIVAHNEENNLEECLKSCKWADEIVVIDAGSTDKTSNIAKSYNAKVYRVKNNPLMKINMNLSFEKCTSDWIFSLDADERITLPLQKEILSVINSNSKNVAYQVPRKNIIFNKWIEHTGWYPDYQIRLFKKNKAKFPGKNVHELLEADGTLGTLENDFYHLNYVSVSQFITKLNTYTDWEANKLIEENYNISWKDSLIFPTNEFCKRFFSEEGYKDGLHGLVLSLLMAFYWEVVFTKVWERKENFKDLSPQNLPKEFSKEFKNNAKQIKYWIYTALIKESRSKKTIYKILRKLR